MTGLEQRLADWHDRKFETIDGPATFRKLCEEIGELGAAIMLCDSENIREEVGDCAIVLAHIVRLYCPETPSLEAAMTMCLEKIERRLAGENPGGNYGGK